MVEQAFYTWMLPLVGSATLRAGKLAQTDTLPAVVFNFISCKRIYDLKSYSGLAKFSLQLDHYGFTSQDALTLAAVTDTNLDSFTGTWSSTQVAGVFLTNRQMLPPENAADGSNKLVYRLMTEYESWVYTT